MNPQTQQLIINALVMRRDAVMSRLKISKDLHNKLKRTAQARGWKLGQTLYIAATIGIEELTPENNGQAALLANPTTTPDKTTRPRSKNNL